MEDIPSNISDSLQEIYKKTSPISIFLYGSRARKDFVENSDFEIGILYKRDKKVSRRDLAKDFPMESVNIYPFVYEDFINLVPDTPFQKRIYMRSLVENGRTLLGEKVIEGMEPPKISLLDLLEESIFQVARAYAAVLSFRNGDLKGASAGFVKSSLFGARVLMILKDKKFTSDYNEMAKIGETFDLSSEYKSVLEHALKVRNGDQLDQSMLFTNISFLNNEVSGPLRKVLDKEGDKEVL